ncbi:MAG: membrane or secreted protein [Rubripirellula sp.]
MFTLIGFSLGCPVGLAAFFSRHSIAVVLMAASLLVPSRDAIGQDAVAYQPAIELLPETVAGLVRVPDLPKFCTAWKSTNAGQLIEHPSMKPFVDAQRDRAKDYLQSLDNKIGLKLEDLYEIGSGEAVFAWLPFENDKRRPFAICVVADIRGRKAKADQVMATLDTDLKAGGWIRTDAQHRGETVRVYNTKPKPGQLKVEQIAITLSGSRLITADRDSVVTDLLDAIAGAPKGPSISAAEDFRTVLTQSARAIRGPATANGGIVAIEWFARPFQMGRIVRESLDIDRGNQVDVLKLLQNQGFEAIKGVGGIAIMAGDPFDILHKGFVWAPGVTGKPDKYEMAARMLQFPNEPAKPLPTWIGDDVATVNRLNVKIEEAFWAAESLVNEAFGDAIFRDIIDGIREDEDGPQIDIEKNVLPNLDNHVLLITDNTLPADINSDRMLVAIRVSDAAAIKLAIRKAMEVEPDASQMDALPGLEIWRVQRGEGTDDFDAELFGDLAIEEEEETDEPPPLLDHWAIALVEKGPGSDAPYLMFSSHPEFLVETAKRIQQGTPGGFGSQPRVIAISDAMKQLKADPVALDRFVRTKLSLRVKYQLLRQNRLKESDTLIASLIRRAFEDADSDEPDLMDATKLPPLTEIEHLLPEAASYITTTEDGWEMTSFFLQEVSGGR